MTLYQAELSTDENGPNWLELIRSKKKVYEGRINRPSSKWSSMKLGDSIVFHRGNNEHVCTVIEEIVPFDNFGEAFDKLGAELFPIETTTEKVVEYYNTLYSEDEIKKFGVIAIKLKVIEIYD